MLKEVKNIFPSTTWLCTAYAQIITSQS